MYATEISNLTSERRKVKVDLQTETLTKLPVNGKDVDNLADDVTFEIGSSLLVVSTSDVYLYDKGGWKKLGS